MGAPLNKAITKAISSRTLTKLNWSHRRWLWLPFLLGVAVLLAWVYWLEDQVPQVNLGIVSGPVVAVDINQHRANVVLPPPQGNTQIRQSFYPRWAGLREIELLLARDEEAEGQSNGRLQLQLLDDAGTVVAERDVNTRSLSHNQLYNFRFPPQPQSAGRRYQLQISGSEDNTVSVQGYSLDVYEPGRLALSAGALAAETPPTSARELRFITRYRLMWQDVAIALGTILARDGWLMLVALLFIPMPGCLLLLLGPKWWRRWDTAAWWGVAWALGLAAWPWLWFGMTLAGLRWWGWSLWLFWAVGWALVAFLWWWRGESEERGAESVERKAWRVEWVDWRWEHVLLLLLLLLAVAVRLLAVRDVDFPPWVDSSRHALITAVMAEQGQTPSDYRPYLPVDRFPYHFGFHTLAASLRLMTDWPLPPLLLYLGQLLNGMVPLTVYAAVWLMTRRRGAGLLAAFLVALPFFFPGYYATWGRLTQLTAVLLLPVLLALTWLLVRGGRGWRAVWWLVAWLAAGLFLIHFRVFLFYLPFVLLVWLVSRGRHGRWLAAATALALLLVAPRIVQLATIMDPIRVARATIDNYNAFPTSYLEVGWEQQFAWLAAVLLLPTVVSAVHQWRTGRGRHWAVLPLVLVGWVALLFLLLAGEYLGLPETTIVNMNSLYITLFLPLALFLAVTADRFWRWLGQKRWPWRWLAAFAAGASLAAAFLFGAQLQVTILNSQTILAHREDVAGLAWVEARLPADATVAVNSWRWLGNTWAGHDGGAWLVPLTGRASTTPPADYLYNPDLFQEVDAFNEAATSIPDWSDPGAASWLRQEGVTHVFVGARGGFFDPAALNRNPEVQMVYGRNGVFVFEVQPQS